jgi:hypothetical protein
MPIDFPGLLSVLSSTQVRYVLVGGLAVVLHGFERLTTDADIIIDLAPDNARNIVRGLVDSGYRALAPVDPLQFADPEVRSRWQKEKGPYSIQFLGLDAATP